MPSRDVTCRIITGHEQYSSALPASWRVVDVPCLDSILSPFTLDTLCTLGRVSRWMYGAEFSFIKDDRLNGNTDKSESPD